MPELPEVEIVRRTLEPHLLGRQITGVKALWEKSLFISEAARILFASCPAWTVLALKRRGKLLLVELGREAGGPVQLCAGFHLKMTGQLLVKGAAALPGRHTRIVLEIEGPAGADLQQRGSGGDTSAGNRLFFDDQRKFGFCRIMLPEEKEDWAFLRKLGPEPLEIDPLRFALCFCKQGADPAGRAGPDGLANPIEQTGPAGEAVFLKGKIKSLLLNQEIVAGIGNIYADEALFRAGIRPDRAACTLSLEQLTRLGACVQEVLRRGIAAGGSSIRDYLDAEGRAGAFQEEFQVYGRKGLPCPVCGSTLTQIKLAGRSTVFCPACQQ